jgi:hypothetical protein
MSTITLEDAISYLEKANAIIIDDDILTPTILVRGVSEDENEPFFCLRWMETNESACELLFYDEDNDEVKIQNSTIYLINDAGEEIPITILKEYDIEFEKNK